MALETKMISTRLPRDLVERIDFVVRNSEPDQVKNRSTAVFLALSAWLPNEEQRLKSLGLALPKKAAR